MNNITDMVYQFALRLVKVICLVLTAILFASGFLLTSYAEDMTSQAVLIKWDNPLGSLAGICVFLFVAGIICRWVKGNPGKRKRILLLITLSWYLFMGLALVLFSRTVPAADALSVFYAAHDISVNNLSSISAPDSYLSYYPHQVGLLAYFEIIIRIWNFFPFDLPAYHVMKCLNVGWVCLLIYAQYRAIQLLFHDDRYGVIYLLITIFHFPLLMYTSFVYGEIPSFALFSFGLWMLGDLFHKMHFNIPNNSRRVISAILSALCFAGSIALRKNNMILMIAVILVVLLEAFRRKRLFPVYLAGLYLIFSLGTLPAITSFYEYRASGKLSSGVPPLSYIAMGMQESSRASGWYNGFNFNTYQETRMDTDLTNKISQQAIWDRIACFRDDPAYAASFYTNKFLSQWADGTYASRQATLATYGGRTEFFQQLYDGKYSPAYIELCNLLQNIIYMGAFVSCLASLQKKKISAPCMENLLQYLCLIGVVGGFLFHMFWEANARYIFPYGLLLIPYASRGCGLLLQHIEKYREMFCRNFL